MSAQYDYAECLQVRRRPLTSLLPLCHGQRLACSVVSDHGDSRRDRLIERDAAGRGSFYRSAQISSLSVLFADVLRSDLSACT
jgi:hypothetical protein